MAITNWSGDENAIMKGYIEYAIKELNRDYQEETGKPFVDDETKQMLFNYLRRATDDLTAQQAYDYYMSH